MEISVPNIRKLKLRTGDIIGLMLLIYLCEPFVTAIFQKLLGVLGLSSYGIILTIMIMLFPYMLLCAKKCRVLVIDFWVLYAVIVLFFFFTYLIHPEYKYWYEREDYGVIAYVLRPDNGLFIYLILRLMNNPSEIIKYIKCSGWIMYVWYGRQLLQALVRGYWIDTTNRGYEIHMSYNLSLGYNILLFVLVFMFCVLEKKRLSDFLGAGVGIAITLLAGSRGPFLDIAIFILLYIIVKFTKSRKKITFILGGGLIVIFGIIALPYLLTSISGLLENWGLSSRFITKLMSGDIMDDSGRTQIWLAAVNMIKENPLGYGAMGSRHVIYQYIYVAHPHQFFLELLIDFGVILGTVIIAFLGTISIWTIRIRGNDEWRMVFIIFFARACQLLVSLTFWHSIGLWGMLAVWVCIRKSGKKIIKKNMFVLKLI